MEAILSTLLKHLNPQYSVTVLGVSREVVETVTSFRPNTRTMVIPRVKAKTDLQAIVGHLRAIRKLRPDLVLASLAQPYDAQYALLAAEINRIPVMAVVHCVVPSSSRLQQMIFRRLSRRVSASGGVSQSVCRESERELHLRSGTFTLLYNGVENMEFIPQATAPRSDSPVIGGVGRFVSEKRFDLLIAAMVELNDCRLVLLGNSPEFDALKSLAKRLGVDDRVQFTGWVDPPWTSKWHFDVLAAPSSVEGFGLVVVEAMLACIPVVAI